MMSLWGHLTGSTKAVNKVVEGVYSGLDKVVFTPQERAELNLKVIEKVGQYMQQTSGQNLARRLSALMVTSLWCLLVVMATLFGVFGAGEQSDFLFDVLADIVNPPFMIIMGFYFFTHALRGREKK